MGIPVESGVTVGELIAELSRLPQHVPARIFIPYIIGGTDETGHFNDEHIVHLSKDSDYSDVDVVRFEGNHVMIEGSA